MFPISALLRAHPGGRGINSPPSLCSLVIIRPSGLRRGGVTAGAGGGCRVRRGGGAQVAHCRVRRRRRTAPHRAHGQAPQSKAA